MARRKAVREVANQIFDFQETAKRSLGRHWQNRTLAERTEFTRLFADLLERAYISKIDQYSGENVKYVSESIEGIKLPFAPRSSPSRGLRCPLTIGRSRRRQGQREQQRDQGLHPLHLCLERVQIQLCLLCRCPQVRFRHDVYTAGTCSRSCTD